MSDTIVFLDPLPRERLDRLAHHAGPRFAIANAASRDPEDQLSAIREARFAISGDVPITGAMLREGAANGLLAVHKWGVGIDNFDLETAREVGVRVLRTTGSNAVAVAETALGLMLALNRQLVAGHVGLLGGEWLKATLSPQTATLSGKTVGLVGLGYIGKNVARFLKGFGCRVLYMKPTPLDAAEEAELGVVRASLAEILAESDVVSLHCALTAETRGLIGRDALAAMKPSAILVNTARGGIVIEDDLADALEAGRLRGAAIDVYEVEPAPPNHRLVGMANVVTTPHIAALAADTFATTVGRMFANLAAVADGAEVPPLDVVV